MKIVFFLEIIGTVAFAISGAGVAIENKLDVFGVAILGLTTAVGGGILRDVLLGATPPVAFQQPIYIILSLLVSIIVFFPKIRVLASNQKNPVFILIDAIGLGVFTVIGADYGMELHNGFLAVFVGVVTGVGGGVLRDLFAGKKPYIFVKHFYACASLLGAVVTVLLWPRWEQLSLVLGACTVVILRLLAARYRWSLPKA